MPVSDNISSGRGHSIGWSRTAIEIAQFSQFIYSLCAVSAGNECFLLFSIHLILITACNELHTITHLVSVRVHYDRSIVDRLWVEAIESRRMGNADEDAG